MATTKKTTTKKPAVEQAPFGEPTVLTDVKQLNGWNHAAFYIIVDSETGDVVQSVVVPDLDRAISDHTLALLKFEAEIMVKEPEEDQDNLVHIVFQTEIGPKNSITPENLTALSGEKVPADKRLTVRRAFLSDANSYIAGNPQIPLDKFTKKSNDAAKTVAKKTAGEKKEAPTRKAAPKSTAAAKAAPTKAPAKKAPARKPAAKAPAAKAAPATSAGATKRPAAKKATPARKPVARKAS